ncbi:hypothetical protein JQ621_18090 [Bradyrhizobium manausense]|jgi:hypothetical protein|uniref:hypothetical protein n=1 Tax=Bradyrhizobium manausense TaxID=989370 RepID=UPI001BA5C55C|nr:hypothetical protein [Bradyrhizobium manausense]MBR1089376.1 hypothetical protein [Bradyrhizobium manausense]
MSTEHNNKSAETPASIPAVSELEKERQQEIGNQVRAAVGRILTKRGSVSAAQLAKWGPDGTEFFFRVLRKGIDKQMSKLAPALSVPPAKSAKGRGETVKTKARTEPVEANETQAATLPVSLDRNWTDQQRNLRPMRARAILHGLIVAAILFVGAAMSMQLLDALASFILQQLQNWI